MNLNKGIADIILLLTIAIFGITALPIVSNINNQEPLPTPTEVRTPTVMPTITPSGTPSSTTDNSTIDYSGTGDFEETKGNSHVKIESNGGTSSVHVESSENSSSEVTVKNNVNVSTSSN